MATHSSILPWSIYLMDRGAWRAIVHGVTRIRHELVTKLPLEKPQLDHTDFCWQSESLLFMYDYYNKKSEKQSLKSKKHIQFGVKIGASL